MTAHEPPHAAIHDPDVRIWHGEARQVLAHLEPRSVQTVVTSPPFWQLRDYGTGEWTGGDDPACDHVERLQGRVSRSNTLGKDATHPDRDTLPPGKIEEQPVLYAGTCGRCGAQRADAQIGLEETPAMWVDALVDVFRSVRRVLRDDGTVWLECGDTHIAYNANRAASRSLSGSADAARPRAARGLPGLKAKDLVMAPFLLALGLQADGWYVRQVNIWHRPNPMPESAKDRPTTAHTYVFLLSKRARYFYDGYAIRDPAANDPNAGGRQRALRRGAVDYAETLDLGGPTADRKRAMNGTKRRTVRPGVDTNGGGQGSGEMSFPLDTANARTVWSIPTEPTPFAHFATFPQALVEKCIKAGSSEHGCCSACGSPYRRVLENRTVLETGSWHDGDPEKRLTIGQRADPGLKLMGSDFYNGYSAGETAGWEPTCACSEPLPGQPPPPVVPCTVIDPFMGSGTTALVARRLGRHAVGAELSAEYLAIARSRLAQLSLLA